MHFGHWLCLHKSTNTEIEKNTFTCTEQHFFSISSHQRVHWSSCVWPDQKHTWDERSPSGGCPGKYTEQCPQVHCPKKPHRFPVPAASQLLFLTKICPWIFHPLSFFFSKTGYILTSTASCGYQLYNTNKMANENLLSVRVCILMCYPIILWCIA